MQAETRESGIFVRGCVGRGRTPRLATLGLLTMVVAAVVLGAVVAARAADPSIEDGDITRAIEADLWSDPLVDANRVDVVTSDGIVRLSGTVRSLLARDRAEAIAESIVGVRAVVNRIEVGDYERDDAVLAKAVEDALARDPVTDDWKIDVEASKGTVTLTGEVESWAEMNVAETVARGVPGVREVRNRLEIQYPSARSDDEIAAEVRARLANDVRVDDYGIEVAVDHGRVVLSGTVGSLAEKRRAWADAWVGGVQKVDGEGLGIRWWARDEMRRKGLFERRPDDQIERAVRDAFAYDPRVEAFEPRVHSKDGVVTLSGVVDNLAAKQAAESDARNVVGVIGVRNHLKVRPQEIPSDAQLEARVRRALADDEFVERWKVDVLADAGTVYLTGDVKSSFEKDQAGLRAARVNGVVDVVNELGYQYDWRWRPDWEIRSAVRDQLVWSPFVDADDIDVSVEDGVVTLTGEVDTWGERSDAEKNAWEGGAKDVRNELTVKHLVRGPIAYYNVWGAVP